MKIVFIFIGIVVIFIMCIHCTFKLRTRKNSLEPFTYLQHAISSIANPNDVRKSRIEIISEKCVNDPKQCIIDHRMNNRQISWDVPNTSLNDQTISESTQKCIADPLACFQKEKEALKTSVDWDVYDKNKDEILKNIHDYYQTYFRETEYLSREERLEQMYIMWKFKRQTVKENSTITALPMVDHAIRTHFSNLGYLLTSNLNPSSLYIATVISNTGVTEYLNINDETHKNIISKHEQTGKLNREHEGPGSDDEEEIVLHEITLSAPNMSFFELMLLMDSLYIATGKFKIEYPLGEDAFIEMKPILEDAIDMYRYNTNKKPTTSPLSVTPSMLRDEYEFVLIDEEWIENTLKTFE
jgi:hypothetical protein